MSEIDEIIPMVDVRRQRLAYAIEYLLSSEEIPHEKKINEIAKMFIAQEDRAQKRIEWLENRILDLLEQKEEL